MVLNKESEYILKQKYCYTVTVTIMRICKYIVI